MDTSVSLWIQDADQTPNRLFLALVLITLLSLSDKCTKLRYIYITNAHFSSIICLSLGGKGIKGFLCFLLENKNFNYYRNISSNYCFFINRKKAQSILGLSLSAVLYLLFFQSSQIPKNNAAPNISRRTSWTVGVRPPVSD